MKSTSFILLLLISISALSQKKSHNQNALEKILFSIPDSIFLNHLFEFQQENRHLFWETYTKNDYRQVEDGGDKIFGDLNLFFDSELFGYAFIDEKSNLLRIMGRNDDIPTYEIKCFNLPEKKIVAITLKYYDFATTVSDMIVFYKKEMNEYFDITNEVLNSFNFYTDNYSDSTNKRISEIYELNVEKNPLNNHLLYTFSASDTVYITESHFGLEEDIGLDTTYFDGEFYTKKYIMENGKLRLAE